ncbi:cbb3-type cytochrome oxidase assembly protein CcoS [Maricaulis salignorans]|uniref:Cytochrome oxidase maturation protein, cbb3-type n=1 Tax=Maricaulis salignorans TaxID=144026 RepID=A0A1G9WHY7_9PROT|nr:cbb3-type cytochrome oxidase assembly protein CcoS [Maricaulis salignorans]SDM84154.1 cytochrome oxidase maturation protein, cbb3-type [Maricaulis salignorans]
MNALIWLIPIALGLGFLGLVGFLWSLKSGQFEDLDGAGERILIDDDKPLQPRPQPAEAEDEGDGAKSL